MPCVAVLRAYYRRSECAVRYFWIFGGVVFCGCGAFKLSATKTDRFFGGASPSGGFAFGLRASPSSGFAFGLHLRASPSGFAFGPARRHDSTQNPREWPGVVPACPTKHPRPTAHRGRIYTAKRRNAAVQCFGRLPAAFLYLYLLRSTSVLVRNWCGTGAELVRHWFGSREERLLNGCGTPAERRRIDGAASSAPAVEVEGAPLGSWASSEVAV